MILRLAVKDILHDWLLSSCLILAIASIIAPLLILFGLKFGTIETLRSRLIEDPKNREIRPLSSSSFTREWIETTATGSSDISFIVPMTRQISTSVQVHHPSGNKATLSFAPTGEGDPLLLENGVVIPDSGACVLTEVAATALKAEVGDEVSFHVRRIIKGRTETGKFNLQVAGILDSRASALKTAFVQLSLLEAVEDYKDGRAVPEMGWEGSKPYAYAVYEGAALFLPQQLSKIEEVLLTNNTGFSGIERVSQEEAPGKLGYKPNPEWVVYLLSVKKRPAQDENLGAVKNKLRGKGAVIIPWIRPLPVELSMGKRGDALQLDMLAISSEVEKVSTVSLESLLSKEQEEGEPVISLPASRVGSRLKGQLTVMVEGRELNMPVRVTKGEDAQVTALTDAAVAGRLNLLRYRNVQYDDALGGLLLSRRGYAGFRLYTSSIDTVANVQQRFEEQGISVHTEKERIGEVKRLDKYLSLVFWLIAAVGVIGGISAMTASLFASVERKKKDLNVLRLLGLKTLELVRFPVFQGVVLASAGVGLACIVFVLVARVINQLFREHLRAAESLCTLSLSHFVILVAGVFTLSIVSAVLAALQAIRLDPAEALRDE